MKLSRRSSSTPVDLSKDTAPAEADAGTAVGKGRPTPKRRDVVGPRGPVTAPKTRKEAYRRQRELSKSQRAARTAPAGRLTPAQRRELMRKGDPSALPRRDQGDTRRIARDYVDSRRMISNYMLLLFPLLVIGYLIPALQIIVLAIFVGLLAEWFVTGRRIRRMAIERSRPRGRQRDVDRHVRRHPGLPAAPVADARPTGRAGRQDLSGPSVPARPPLRPRTGASARRRRCRRRAG